MTSKKNKNDLIIVFGVIKLLIIKIKKRMKTQKLSLDAFKSMADNVQSEEVMQQIEGGSLFDCHGFWGGIGKAVRDLVIREADRAVDNLTK